MNNGYSAREVGEMLGLSASQLRSYINNGFLRPARGNRGEYRFSFHDLVLLRTARELLDANVSKRKITLALKSLQRRLPHGRPLTAVRITAMDDRIVVRDGDTVFRPDSGQTLFDFGVAELATRVEPFALRKAAAAQDDERSADEWFSLALELEIGAPDDAVDAYRRALDADPDHIEALINLGRLLHERGEIDEAEESYRAAIALDPEQPTAHYNLAILLEDAGRADEALEAYRTTLRLDDTFADAHYNLAGLYEAAGQTSLAIRHLKAYKQLIEA